MSKLRTCTVNGREGYFHRWTDKAQVVAPGIAVGSHPGGQMWLVFGVVEYADGTVHECYPYEIRFTDMEQPAETEGTE